MFSLFSELSMHLTPFCTYTFSPFGAKPANANSTRQERERWIRNLYLELVFRLLFLHCVLGGFGSQSGAKPFLLKPAERQRYSKTSTQYLKYDFSCYSFILPDVDQLLQALTFLNINICILWQALFGFLVLYH